MLTADYDYCPSISRACGLAIDVGTVPVCIPSLDDLILTKQIASRPKDPEDVRLLRVLKESPR